MSTLDICDRVMVIIDGRLVAFDTIDLLQSEQRLLPLRLGARHRGGVADCCERRGMRRRRAGMSEVDGRLQTARASRAARGGSPTSSSSGTPRAARPRSTRCCAGHPQIYMPDIKEPWFFATELRERTPPRPEGIAARRSRSTCALFAGARPGQRDRRGVGPLPVVARPRPQRSPRCSPTRGSSRSCASPRASCARCTCSS